ncbi:MAG: hypothetical protein ABH841_02940 [Candidatus Nealsonbacteria bacterium]
MGKDESSHTETDKVEIILGRCKIPRIKLDALDWVGIIQGVLENGKPCFKYWSNFEPIGSWLNFEQEHNSRATDVSRVKFPKTIDVTTRCINVGGNLEHEVKGDLSDVKYIKEKKLLITQAGQCLVWDFEYTMVPQRNLGFLRLDSGMQEKSSVCQFSLIDGHGQELLTLFRRYPDLGWRILEYLHSLAKKEAEESKGVMERFKENLDGIESRIG